MGRQVENIAFLQSLPNGVTGSSLGLTLRTLSFNVSKPEPTFLASSASLAWVAMTTPVNNPSARAISQRDLKWPEC